MTTTEPDLARVPLYTPRDAARYLTLPPAAGRVLLRDGPPGAEPVRLSFGRLAEAFVLAGVFDAAPAAPDGAWEVLAENLDDGDLFADGQFAERVAELFPGLTGKPGRRKPAARLAELVPGADPGLVQKAVLRRLTRVDVRDGVPRRLYPFTRDPAGDAPRLVVLDPAVRFGRPTLVGYGVPTDTLVERFRAGDSPTELADDYDVPLPAVLEAIRYETLPAAGPAPALAEW